MSKQICRIIYFVFLMLLASCSSTKTTKSTHFIEGITEMEYVGNAISNVGGWNALTAKTSLTLNLEGKGATKVNGTLRIKKGEVIQLSIVPFLGIEVARVEISPDGVLVIDRLNKRYVEVSFAEVKQMANADLDFHTLQALFLNELFLPGKDRLTPRDISAFKVEQEAKGVVLEVTKSKRFSYRFYTQAPDAILKESCIGLVNTPYRLEWVYDDFKTLERKPFPTNMQIAFEGGEKPVKASIALSRLSTNSNWETHTEVSKKYEKVELDDILKQLLRK